LFQSALLFDLETARQWLSEQLSPERLRHSIGAQEKALELARKFSFSALEQEQASIAGLLHDAAKPMSPQSLLDYCENRNLAIEDVDRKTPQTLHPFVGAELLRETMGLSDETALNAIRYHTTGRSGMSRVEKVVFIADKIEGNTRNPLYIQKMTSVLDFKKSWSLDLTMLFILDSTIQFLMDKHQIIHPRTIAARNDFIEQLRTEGHI